MPVKDRIIDLVVQYGFQVLGALVILVVGLLVARWLGSITRRWLERQRMEPPIRELLVRVVRIVVLLFVLVLMLDKFGVQIAPLVAAIGVAGVGIGFALQGVLSNVIAGLTIIFTKPFRVGEYIELVGVQGQVFTIELFSTTLIHGDQSRVVVPNRKIVGEVLHNFGTVRQLDLAVDVAYGTDINAALAIVRNTVDKNPRVLKDPAPFVGITVLADFAIRVAIKPWVSMVDYGFAQAELYQAIVERFRENKIAIPFPQREVRLLSGS